jgi:hypothetical protein
MESRFGARTEKIKEELAAEQLKARPESADKYALPAIEGVDPDELGKHPLVAWWRQQAFESGIPQEVFAKGVEQYVTTSAPQEIPEEQLRASLGENFKQRIAAVDAWASKEARNQQEMDILKQAATSPAGIQLLERFTGLGGAQTMDHAPTQNRTATLDDLRSMQQDPKYWDPVQRDPAFIKQVEDGYAKLYPTTEKH